MTDLSFTRGDTLTLDTTITGASGLTGCQAVFTVKRHYYDSDAQAVFQKSTAVGTVVINGLIITTVIKHTDTNLLTPGSYLWDLQVTDAAGNVFTVDQGNLILGADVTIT